MRSCKKEIYLSDTLYILNSFIFHLQKIGEQCAPLSLKLPTYMAGTLPNVKTCCKEFKLEILKTNSIYRYNKAEQTIWQEKFSHITVLIHAPNRQ